MDLSKPKQIIKNISLKIYTKLSSKSRIFVEITGFCELYKKVYNIRNIRKPFYLFLLIPVFFIVYPLIISGAIVNGDFPYGDTLYNGTKLLWMWTENGSYNNFEIVARFPIIGILYFFASLGFSPDILSKAMVILGFSLASFSFYFAFVLFFKAKITFDYDSIKLKISALLGALFYAYNVWSFNRVGHWYLWLGYSMLPIFVISVIFSFKNGLKWKYLLAALMTWSFASSTPHMIVFYGLIFIIISLYFILSNVRKKQNLVVVGKPLLLILSLYLLSNAYWILPYFLSSSSLTIAPSTTITEESTMLLSRDSSLLNVFRLIETWWQIGEGSSGPSQTSVFFPVWLSASFFFPILVFLSLIIVKKNIKYLLLFLSLAIVGIFLTIGAQGQINNYFYSLLLFHTPLISQLNWVFRDPDKWAFLIALGYSFSIGIASFEILKLVQKIQHKKLASAAFLITVLGLLIIYSYPVYDRTFEKIFNPIVLPNSIFNNLNNYFSKNINSEKIFFIPYDFDTSGWRQGHFIGGIPQLLSVKPSIGILSPNLKNYYNYFINSIVLNRTAEIKNFIYPLGTPYIIYENDTADSNTIGLIKRLSVLKDVKNIANVGFFKILKVMADNKKIGQLNVPKQNVMIAGGGLDKFLSLNSLKSFNSMNSSLVFLDQYIMKEKYNQTLNSVNSLILGEKPYDLALSFVDDKYVIKPSDIVSHHSPEKVWSKSAATDPLQGPFHPYINNLGIDNWDFDYGKGLVLTWARDKLAIPIEIENNGNYDLFIRYMKNQQGGAIQLSIDNKFAKEIITKDQLNGFNWENAGNLSLKKGKHILTLENLEGLNVVNILAAIPTEETKSLLNNAYSLANRTRDIYLFEPESSFYTSGKYNGIHNLFNSDRNGTFNETFTGQFSVPEKTDLLSLQFWAKKRHADEMSSYTIKNLEIRPAFEKNLIFKSDFENVPNSWINEDKINLFTSMNSQKPISGTTSLRVLINPANVDYWSVISTDFIPAKGATNYDYNLDLSASDVVQLHSKVFYYDSNKKEIKNDFISQGFDGNFEKAIANNFMAPLQTKYLKVQIWVKTNPEKISSYLLDNIKITESNSAPVFVNNFNIFENTVPEDQKIFVHKDSLETQIIRTGINFSTFNDNSYKDWNIIKTEPFSVKPDEIYNYTVTVEAKNLNSLRSLVYYLTDNLHVRLPDSGNQSNIVSDEKGLILTPQSEIFTKIDILKPSQYSTAIRVKTCQGCTFLRISIGDQTHDISLANNVTKYKWFYHTSYLSEGHYKLKIFSDSNTELDSLIMYSSADKNDETLNDIFIPKENSAQIIEYKKINPTKYVVKVNSVKPYILSLAESYDPLWSVYVDGIRKNNNNDNIPLYSIVNGFLINKVGEHTLSIEYEPQRFFYIGVAITLITIMTLPIGYYLKAKTKWPRRIHRY